MLIFNPMVACIIRTSGMQGGESTCGGEVLLDSKGSSTGQPCFTQDKTHFGEGYESPTLHNFI